MNENEYENAWFLCTQRQNLDESYPRREETDSDMICSDMEGSVYNNSDKEVTSEDDDKDDSTSPSPRSKGGKRKRKTKKVSPSPCLRLHYACA
jgi:hypothetical protein